MHRTQIYLDDAHYETLRARAQERGTSMAALIREILDAHLGLGTAASRTSDPLARVIGLAEGDGCAVAEHYEDYLYGNRK